MLLALYLAVRYRDRLRALLLNLWKALMELCSFRSGRQSSIAAPRAQSAAPRRPFSAISNPFASGAAAQLSAETLIILSFQGLEAWAEEHRCERHRDQTPYEFVDQLAAEVPDLAYEAQELARLYAQVAFSAAPSLPACRTVLEVLWSKMSQ